jgi:FkbM family methyltransferase
MHNYQLYVDLLEPPGISSYFFGYADVLPFIDILLKKNEVFIDAGANWGQYTLFGASIVGKQGKVLAFEPNPRLGNFLKKSVEVNNWEQYVVIDSRALWNQSHQQMKLYCSTNRRNSGTSSIVFHGYEIVRDQYIDVETITLDKAVEQQNIAYCHLLKIDVERAEYEVLQGFKTFLASYRIGYILLEMYCHSSAHNFLSQWGYAGFFISVGHGLIDIKEIQDNRFGDYLFINPKVSQEFAQRQACIARRLIAGNVRK